MTNKQIIYKNNFKRVLKFDSLNALRECLYTRIDEYKKDYGVLCFLYSLILTKV